LLALTCGAQPDQGRTLQRWDVSTAQERPIAMPADRICVALAAGGKSALLAHKDRSMFLWDLSTNQQSFLFRGPPNVAMCYAVSPDSKTVFCLDNAGHKMVVWDVAAARARCASGVFPGGCSSWVFSADGKELALAGLPQGVQPGVRACTLLVNTFKLD